MVAFSFLITVQPCGTACGVNPCPSQTVLLLVGSKIQLDESKILDPFLIDRSGSQAACADSCYGTNRKDRFFDGCAVWAGAVYRVHPYCPQWRNPLPKSIRAC